VARLVRLAFLACLAAALPAQGCARKGGPPTGSATSAVASTSPPSSVAKPPVPGENPVPRAREQALLERANERAALIAELEHEGIRDARVLAALRRVPRHRFVPDSVAGAAYDNRPLPIGSGQTISQPYIVAAMTEAVAPLPAERCLEIGTGSGYQAAVLAELCARVYSIEYLPDVASFGRKNLEALGYGVELRQGDGYAGWPEAAPFDVVVVTAAPERVPAPLLAQLRQGGRLVIPVGAEGAVQNLELYRRVAPGSGAAAFERRVLSQVRFVPFLGEQGGAR
jgi:protein-L-isoaspartate(D-aspartate) O-methyltransferase